MMLLTDQIHLQVISILYLQIISNSETWPDYLQLNVRENKRELRSNGTKSLEVPKKESGTFQDNVAKLFNPLPETIRNCSNYDNFICLSNKFLINRAEKHN